MSEKISDHLTELERIMKAADLWQVTVPSDEKLSSTEPFSIDTLTVFEWLQWVYIYRLRALIAANQPLPVGASVAAYAEQATKALGLHMPELLSVLEQIDEEMS